MRYNASAENSRSTRGSYESSTARYLPHSTGDDGKGLHRSDLRLGQHTNRELQHAWNKYGEDEFGFEVIEFMGDPAQVLEREQYWIDYYWGRDTCYNEARQAGSTFGRKRPQSERDLLSQRRRDLMESDRGPGIIERFKQAMADKWTGWPENALQ